MNRRDMLKRTAIVAAGSLMAPAILRAQGAPIKLGVLTPLTGAGGQDGPRMAKAMQAVAKEVNAAGGVLGRSIELVVEDDQTNPEAAVRAAQKLVAVDKVPVIMGTWASSVTSAVAPVCWESQTCLMTVSGSDSITKLPHKGFIIRTQPNTVLQSTKHAEFIASTGAKKVFYLAAQSPFAASMQTKMTEILAANGTQMLGGVIYDGAKTSFRSEIDQALKLQPDMIYLNSYAPDLTVLLKELFRAGYAGGKITQSYAYTTKVAEGLPADVSDGLYTAQPSSNVSGKAYELAAARIGIAQPDSYEAQATDWISMAILSIARAGDPNGDAIRQAVRKI